MRPVAGFVILPALIFFGIAFVILQISQLPAEQSKFAFATLIPIAVGLVTLVISKSLESATKIKEKIYQDKSEVLDKILKSFYCIRLELNNLEPKSFASDTIQAIHELEELMLKYSSEHSYEKWTIVYHNLIEINKGKYQKKDETLKQIGKMVAKAKRKMPFFIL